MASLIAISDWLGHRGEPIDPATVLFTARAGTSCRHCCFDGQRAEVCKKAGELAAKAGLPDCEKSYVIYDRRRGDPRQMSIIEEPTE